MNPFYSVFLAVLPVFTLVAFGFGSRKWKILEEATSTGLLKLTLNLLVPALILDAVLGNAALENRLVLLLAPLSGFCSVVLGFAVAWFLFGLLIPCRTTPNAPNQSSFSFATGIYNYGYFSIPLGWSLFGRDTVGVLMVWNVGVELAIWTIGISLLQPQGTQRWKKIINPPAITLLVALFLNQVGATAHLPQFLLSTAHTLGQCAIPMGLLLIGASLADLLPQFRVHTHSLPPIALAAAIRMVFLPLVFLGMAKFLPWPLDLKKVIVLQASMPCAIFPILLVRQYGGNLLQTLQIALFTTLLSLVTIPLWIHWARSFVLN